MTIFSPSRVLYGCVVALVLVGLALVVSHHLTLDTYILLIELVALVAIAGLGFWVWYTRNVPLCHITFVRLRHSQYIATTEYYRRTAHGEQRLAKAIARAQHDVYVSSVTHREGGREVYIPIHSLTTTYTQPPQPTAACTTCNTLAWEWTGKQYICLTCQAAQEATEQTR